MAGEKILVVDDEKSVRDTFTAVFDEYDVVTVAVSQQALEILSRPNDIDLVVLDIVMPGLTGIELLRKIKRINPGNKVVIITGHSTKEAAIEALRSHADEYIEKPFDIEKTRQIFERLLDKRRNYDKEEIGNAENKINQAQGFIKRNYNKSVSLKDVAKEIFLSPKYLSRIFKERTGRSFSEYKLSLRIEAAKQLLKKYRYTISQIAYEIGYQNPESFMKMFKRLTGLTPLQYRGRSSRVRRQKQKEYK